MSDLRPRAPRTPWWDVAIWVALVAVGALLTVTLRQSWTGVAADAAPFSGSWRVHLTPASALAPVLAVLVVAAGLRGVLERIPWRVLLVAAFLAALAWAVALAVSDGWGGLSGPVDRPGGLVDSALSVGDDPGRLLRTASSTSGAARLSPPGATLVVWALQRGGIRDATTLGIALTAMGCLAVPLVLVAVRSLCHEPAARRLAPVLALAPYAVWVAVSADSVVLALTAAAVACGAVGSEPRRSPWWAAAAGLLLGVASLVSYVAWLLAAAVVITYFVRRRPLPNLITGVTFLVPLFAAQLAGFVWSRGFEAARRQLALDTATRRPASLWALVDLLVVVAVTGPVVIASARKIRRTPGWPFLLGAALGLTFAVASGLARGEVERLLLPFLPWLLVAAVAPERRPRSDDPPERTAAVFPALLTSVGAVIAIVWQATIASPW